jgi:hypothetical protein
MIADPSALASAGPDTALLGAGCSHSLALVRAGPSAALFNVWFSLALVSAGPSAVQVSVDPHSSTAPGEALV